ncbi:Alpha/beta hydrolase fold-3 [Fusarium oxysporum]|nr:Alpha/beta hydrolase fold-3 [Fusarium oxysporum]
MDLDGGGWCIGDLDLEDDLVRFMASNLKMTFLSVDYRLGPEHPWPAQLEDCLAAVRFRWMARPSPQANCDSARLFLVGTSAGAQLAISVAMNLSQTTSRVDGVVALAPFTIRKEDARSHIGSEPRSHAENLDAPVLTMETLDMFLDAVKAPLGDPSFSVLLCPSLHTMPPTYIVTCGADILHDHGSILAERLKDNGVCVKTDHYPGYPHTFWATPGLKMVVAFRSNLLAGLEFIKRSSALN